MARRSQIFGFHDWAARIPIAFFAVLLCWLTARFGAWALGLRAGTYSGLILATCVGLFLFTRVLIVDVTLTLTITLAIWALRRGLDSQEEHPIRWAFAMWSSIAGLLLKGLIAAVFPIAAPWHVLAALRNPPCVDFTTHSERGSYHGFFWFHFINEHVLRFLDLHYPRD